jgi:hypothetical protein
VSTTSPRDLEPRLQRAGAEAPAQLNQDHVRIGRYQLGQSLGAIGASIVNEDDFIRALYAPQNTGELLVELSKALEFVEHWNDDRNFRCDLGMTFGWQ